MKKVIIAMLFAFVLTIAFTGCRIDSEDVNTSATKTEQTDTDSVLSNETATSDGADHSDEDESQNSDNDSAETSIRIPVTPIEDGGNINKS